MAILGVLPLCVISVVLGRAVALPATTDAAATVGTSISDVKPTPEIAYNYTADVKDAFRLALAKLHNNYGQTVNHDITATMRADFHTLCPVPRREPETQADSKMASLGLDAIQQLSNSVGISAEDILKSEQWRDSLGAEFRKYCNERASHLHCEANSPYRTIDGSCNNIGHPAWGMTGMPQKRFLAPDYDDGFNSPRSRGQDGAPLPNPRNISNELHQSNGNQTYESKLSVMLMTWGQFINHDIVGTPLIKDSHGRSLDCCGLDKTNRDCLPVDIPMDDPYYDSSCMNFVRTAPAAGPECSIGERRPINKVTSYLDGSAIYGSTKEEESRLRQMEHGLLREGHHGLLPPTGNDNCILQKKGQQCQLAGDERSNLVASIGALHTLFMREHNRIALHLHEINPSWEDERLYQETRKTVGAIIQHITYHEYLPLIIGKPLINFYNLDDTEFGHVQAYKDYVNAGVSSGFAAAAFRFGHSQIPKKQTYIGPKFEKKKGVVLEKTFHKPYYLQRSKHFGYEGILRWLISDPTPTVDRYLEDGVRDRLFLLQNISLDLASINIQRGREQGVPSYNAWRKWCGLSEVTTFEVKRNGGLEDHDEETAAVLQELYRSPNDIDLYSGGVSEVHVRGGSVGPTFACIIARQFSAMKVGDRYWYENNDTTTGFTTGQLDSIKTIELSKLICENMDIPDIQRTAFLTPKISGVHTRHIPCSFLPDLKFKAWLDKTPKWSEKLAPQPSAQPTVESTIAAEKPTAPSKTVETLAAEKPTAPSKTVSSVTGVETLAAEKPTASSKTVSSVTDVKTLAAEKPTAASKTVSSVTDVKTTAQIVADKTTSVAA
ncbi:chorion peroxidase-like [Mizuhopecten yessoensis]|uniref:Chorion peroxidase n=1 Tax=Mizuhopecten yessoensis TaxID=6573 RepID=A0A210QRR3_MIZYE|nr:chorion peroxidase-like [Mizuhopecten yessoensis]XP_021351644.1 chorion peroxidase-like [Mizuhopecten yessoensis]OWF51425.1 Chorion peroxidase [Mizuhopecten yessoensis]